MTHNKRILRTRTSGWAGRKQLLTGRWASARRKSADRYLSLNPMSHNRINLQLRTDKPANVWRYVYAMQESLCSHDQATRYLFIHALVQWGADREGMEQVFTIAIQYSTQFGQNVDVSQPAHICETDVERVMSEFSDFVYSRKTTSGQFDR